MTNREESGAAEHETFPGPGPLKTDEAKRGIRPMEQMMDAAIERVAREAKAREAKAREAGARLDRGVVDRGAVDRGVDHRADREVEQTRGQAITLRQVDAAALMTLEAGQLAGAPDRRSKGRLRWKGLEVSEEFRNYADRVARGEDLPPFAGKILAEPDPAFPWDPSSQQRSARKALKHQVGMWSGVALFLGLSVAVLVVQVRKQTDAWQTAESPLATVTMANQPPAAASAELTAPVEATGAPAPTNAPAAFNEEVPGEHAALGIEAAAESPARTQASVEPSTVEPSIVEAAPLPPARPAAVARTAAASPVGVAPRATSPSPSAPARTTPATSAVVTTSEPAPKTVGTGGVPASLGTGAASSGDSASALRADPKKEPTREASAMGSLLVESPSF